MKMDKKPGCGGRTGSGSCPVVGFGISGAETSDSATAMLKLHTQETHADAHLKVMGHTDPIYWC